MFGFKEIVMMITIFTPTFNRAYTLPRLFESLKNQTFKNFEWLIVDDGSKDETEELVSGFISENQLNITYIKQENKGKHFAINNGLRLAKGDFFLNIDSDDYLLENAVSEIESLSRLVESEEFAGFSFIHFAENINYNPTDYGNKTWKKPEQYAWNHRGEMMFCLKTKVYQKFPFPEFDGEKFCPESLVLRRIENKYKILYTDKVLVRGDYLEDGLSIKFHKLLQENPHGALLNYKERIEASPHIESKLFLARNYYEIAWRSKKTTMKEKFFNLPIGLTFNILWSKLTSKK